MRLTGSTHVVLRGSLRTAGGGTLPRGARGVVVRNTGAAVIVRFTESGQVVSVKSDKLDVVASLHAKGEA